MNIKEYRKNRGLTMLPHKTLPLRVRTLSSIVIKRRYPPVNIFSKFPSAEFADIMNTIFKHMEKPYLELADVPT